LSIHHGETKGELVKRRGIEDSSFDFALPQDWLDEVVQWCRFNGYRGYSYRDILYGFVWMYDEKAKVFGRPYPLTYLTQHLLTKLPMKLGGTGDAPT
jgi:hypothetical protein